MSPDGGSITLANSSIGNGTDNKATITVTQPGTVSKTGGILAAVETKKDTDKKIRNTICSCFREKTKIGMIVNLTAAFIC